MTKKCTCCKKEKELREFGSYAKTSDGVAKRCKECNRRAYYRKINRQKTSAQCGLAGLDVEIKKVREEAAAKIASGGICALALPRTYNIFTSTYVPPTTLYCRNDGNKHIKSLIEKI